MARLAPLAALLAALLCAGLPARAASEEQASGPHAREALRHAGEPDAEWTRLQAPEAALRPAAASSATALVKRVYGYLPYWVSFDPATFRWETITDLVLFSADLAKDGTISSWHGFPQTAVIAKAHAMGVKVHLCATLFNSSSPGGEITAFLGSAGARAAAVQALVAKAQAAGIDGLDFDLEFVPSTSRDAYVSFVQQARTALRAAIPGAELTLAVPPGLGYKGYDPAGLSAAADRLLIMFYDYHWSSAPSTGPVAPLTKGGFWGSAVSSDLDAYLAAAPAAKLALGVPYYGNDWTAASDQRNAATLGKGTAVLVKSAIPNAASRGRLWDAASQTPWYTYLDTGGARRQCWYDDDQSLALKLRLARGKDLAGAMIWALGYDTGRPEVGDALLAELGAASTDGGTGGAALVLQQAAFAPAQLAEGGLVSVQLTVKNTGSTTLAAAAPPPDTVYDETQVATGPVAGTFRLAVDASGRSSAAPDHPWRWGLAAPLAPGATATVTAQVRLHNPGLRELWAAVVLEGTGVVQDLVGKTPVEVLAADAGTPDGGAGTTDGGRDPGPPGGETTAAVGGGCAEVPVGAWALLALLGAGLARRRVR